MAYPVLYYRQTEEAVVGVVVRAGPVPAVSVKPVGCLRCLLFGGVTWFCRRIKIERSLDYAEGGSSNPLPACVHPAAPVVVPPWTGLSRCRQCAGRAGCWLDQSVACPKFPRIYCFYSWAHTLLLHYALKAYSFFWCCVGSDRVAGVSVSIGTLDLMRVDGRHAFVVFYGVLIWGVHLNLSQYQRTEPLAAKGCSGNSNRLQKLGGE